MLDSIAEQGQVVVAEDEYMERYGFNDSFEYKFRAKKGLSEEIVREISAMKSEPEWMLEKRLIGYKQFLAKPTPQWGGNLNDIDYDDIYYYLKPTDKKGNTWESVPDEIKKTFDKLGIPEAERKFFAGAEAQYDSEVVYSHIKEELTKEGVIFTSTDEAVKKYPELMKKYFGTVIPPTDNKFAALNTAVWSGGSFIHIPKGVKLKMPLQAYFRINSEKAGQFERTLIIADEGADVTYIEGCLPADELVSNGCSFEPIVNIAVQDGVVTHTGRIENVNQLFVHEHEGLMYNLVPQSKFNGFRLTGEHPVLCVKRKDVLVKRSRRGKWQPEVSTKMLLNSNPKFINADQLEIGDFLLYMASNLIEDDGLMDEDHLKILGLYLAEGSISANKVLNNRKLLSFSFGCNRKEADLAKELHKMLGKNKYKSSICKGRGKYYIVSSCAKDLIDFCELNCGKGAAKKALSANIMKLEPKRQKILLDYYWLGDGNRYVRNGKRLMRASTTSKALALQIQEILARNGIFANLNLRKGSVDEIMGRRIKRRDQIIIEYTENRRIGEVRARGNSFFVPIKKIYKNKFKGPVYNLSVNKDESYLVRGFAVHNCTAPIYTSSSLHSAVVELVAHKNATIRYITIQNWSKNVYNLVTQRAFAYENAFVSWTDANIGSKLNMKYPSVFLKERGARGEILSIAIAGPHQVQDSGGKIYHLAPDTTSQIISKSVSSGDGVATYRGLLHIGKDASNVKSTVRCDALLLDEASKTNTFPYMEVKRDDATITHEASTGKVGEEQLFYLMSRGLSEEEALTTIVLGFLDPLARALPLEYSLELKRLIKLDMTGSVG